MLLVEGIISIAEPLLPPLVPPGVVAQHRQRNVRTRPTPSLMVTVAVVPGLVTLHDLVARVFQWVSQAPPPGMTTGIAAATVWRRRKLAVARVMLGRLRWSRAIGVQVGHLLPTVLEVVMVVVMAVVTMVTVAVMVHRLAHSVDHAAIALPQHRGRS